MIGTSIVSGVSGAGTVTPQSAITPVVRNIFGAPVMDDDILFMWSGARRLTTAYSATGPVMILTKSTGGNTTINMVDGLVPWSAVQNACVGGDEIYASTMYDQSPQLRVVANVAARQPRVGREGVPYTTFGNWACLDVGFNRVPKISSFAISSKGLAAAAPMWTEYNDDGRLVSYVGTGRTVDYDHESSSNLLGIGPGPLTERYRNAAGGVERIRGGVSTPAQTITFGATGYQVDGTSWINQDGTFVDGASGFTASFTTGTLRLGATTDAGDGNPFARFPEVVILKNPTKAKITQIYNNMKAFYGLP